jgi:hypothetical protein
MLAVEFVVGLVCAKRIGALKQKTRARSAQAKEAGKNLRAGKDLRGGENLPAGEYLDVCVFLISSRILSCELRRRTTARWRAEKLRGRQSWTRIPANQQIETPSILPWQDRGRVKIGIESNEGGAVSSS